MILTKNSRISALVFAGLAIATINVQASPLSRSYQRIKAGTSLNWAGYVSSRGKFTEISGTWTIPDVHNNKHLKTDSAWVGIGGVNSHDLIQAGTESTTGGGKVSYSAWYELLPDYAIPIDVAINSGDSVSVDISRQTKDQWKILFTNNSTGQNFEKSFQYTSTLSSAEWIEEMPSNGNYDLIPLDNFRAVQFINAYTTRNGKRMSIGKSGASAITMLSAKGKILATPTPLGSDSASFEVKRAGAIKKTKKR